MAKKQKAEEPGSPLWCLTYGDMITQCMAFFIMMFALSEIKADKAKIVIAGIQRVFNRQPIAAGAGGPRTATSFATRIKAAKPAAVTGPDLMVLSVRGGKMIVVGGRVLFDRGSSKLRPGSLATLDEVAERIRGLPNRVEIRGHAAPGEVRPGGAFADDWDLSWHRAKAVADYLSKVGGIPERRLRITGCSHHDAAAPSWFQDEESRNRRVEIVEVGEMVPR